MENLIDIYQARILVVATNTGINSFDLLAVENPYHIKTFFGAKFYYTFCNFRKKFVLKTLAPCQVVAVYVDSEEDTEQEGHDDSGTVPGHESRPWIIGF